jgi:hypothetical protein
MTFPAGTNVGITFLAEVVGIGPGTIASCTTGGGPTITYTVANPLNIPAVHATATNI